MNEELDNDLALLLSDVIEPIRKREIIQRILLDPEGVDLLPFVLDPELAIENNFPIPFLSSIALIIGYCEGYLCPFYMENIRYAGLSQQIKVVLENDFLPLKFPIGGRLLEFSYEPPQGCGSLGFKIQTIKDSRKSEIKIAEMINDWEAIEVWQHGHLTVRDPSKMMKNQSLTELQPGIVYSIREADSIQGFGVLLIECDFSTGQWKTIFLNACFSGDFSDASYLLNEKIVFS